MPLATTAVGWILAKLAATLAPFILTPLIVVGAALVALAADISRGFVLDRVNAWPLVDVKPVSAIGAFMAVAVKLVIRSFSLPGSLVSFEAQIVILLLS